MGKCVVTFGCWDLLHVGHLEFLERARALGDYLVVGIAADEVILWDKGRLPVVPLADRVRMLRALRVVGAVLTYRVLGFRGLLESLRPAPKFLAVGEGWGGAERHRAAEGWCRASGCEVVRLPYYAGESTTRIVRRVLQTRRLEE